MARNLTDKQLDIPKNEVEFENFSVDFFREHWKYPKTTFNGVKGSGQKGVDVYGWPEGKDGYYGVQCKWKDRSKGKKLIKKDDIYDEIEEAKKFTPKLKEFIIVTTATRDTEIQKIEREITEKHKTDGLFGFQIMFWEDFEGFIPDMPVTREKWFPLHFGSSNTPVRLSELQNIKNEDVHLLEGNISSGNQVNIQGDNNIVITQVSSDDGKVYNARVDTAKKFLETFNPDKAITELESLKKDIWNECGDFIKFRILANLGSGYAQIGQTEKAASFFIEALQYNPKDEKALLNAALGYVFLDNKEEAKKKIDEVIRNNPQSGRAYSLLVEIQDKKKSLIEITALVPSNLLKDSDVLHAISRAAKEKGRYDLNQAEKLLRIALDNETPKNHETQAALAEVLLQQVVDDHMVVFAGHIDGLNKKKINESIYLFSKAWEQVENSELRKYKTSWLINRSMAKGLTDRKEAESDIALAIAADPENSNVVRAKAAILLQSGKIEEVIKWLEDNKTALQSDPSLSFMFAGILRESGQTDKAAAVLEELLKNPKGETENHDAKRLLIQVHLDQKNYDKAKDTLALIPDIPKFAILNLLESARIKSAQGLGKEANIDLDEAKKHINEATPKREKLELADAFYSLQRFSDSAELFEGLVDEAGDDKITKKFINSLYRDGQYPKALSVVESLKSKAGLSRYVVEIEASIFDQIGDPKKSEEICMEYLAKNSDDKEIRIRLATTKMRLGKSNEEVLNILKGVSSIDGLDFEHASLLARLYKDIGENFKSLDLAYEIRRSYFSIPDAHLYYTGIFLEREKQNDAAFEKSTVGLDTVVRIKNSLGVEDVFILEDRKNADSRSNEINKESELYKKLFGKKKGDVVEINEISNEKMEIVEIKSKYVHAFQEVLSKYNTIFPGAQGLVGFTFDSSTPEKQSQSVQKMLDQISNFNKQVTTVEDFYSKGQLTIGAFASFLGKNPIEIFSGLMASQTVRLRVAVGTKEEIESSIQHLRSFATPKILTDVTGLISINGIGLGDKLVKKFGKIGVTQSTVDLVTEIIQEKKGVASRGYMSVSKEGEKFVKEEFSSERVEKIISNFEDLRKWISENCEIAVVPPDLLQKFEKRKDVEKLLGKSFTDTLLVASKKEHIFYTDDERLRSYAKSEHGFEGVWTQLVLMELLDKKFITNDEYVMAILKLVNSNYFFTMINNSIIYRAAKEAGWDISKPMLTKILNLLSEDYTDYNSGGIVAAEFLRLIWDNKTIELVSKKKITSHLLSVLTLKKEHKIKILANFLTLTQKYFSDNNLAREEVISIINESL